MCDYHAFQRKKPKKHDRYSCLVWTFDISNGYAISFEVGNSVSFLKLRGEIIRSLGRRINCTGRLQVAGAHNVSRLVYVKNILGLRPHRCLIYFHLVTQ